MAVSPRLPLPPQIRARTVTAVLGPTNTGKTHLAIERMLAHPSGLIGLPLRLLAREVYTRVAERVGANAVALITGEEKVLPPSPRFFVCTVEAMPDTTDVSFVAIDEVQLAGDLERGRVFTDRILSLRGRDETLLLGATTVRPLLEKLIPGINVVTRPRMSVLTYSGQKKITRLPLRSAIVAFSAGEVYAIAELIRRQRGGAAVVLGSLSPRTRNAQVDLFQAGDVDFLVATDAIGMGLNLDVDHVAFASNRKFDGYQYRLLNPAEIGQIAGRAGRHTRDGTFGVTGRADPFDDELVKELESHRFAPVRVLQWRSSALDFASLTALRQSLDEPPREEGLTRAPPGDDVVSLDFAMRDPEIRDLAGSPARVERLWEVCQVPDYRKIAPANHADLILALYGYLIRDGWVSDDWFSRQVAFADRTDGDIDTLSNRIAHIRTWTYVANRGDWLSDPDHWRGITRDVEDRLSDALHERLTQRFVDRRTSVLMRRLRENAMLDAEITATGDVTVEGQHVGHLHGFRFVPAAGGEGPDGKALRAAAAKALAGEIERRAERVGRAGDGDFVLAADGAVRWQGEAIAKLIASEDALKPGFVLLADEHLTGPGRELVDVRVRTWIASHLGTILKPLFDLLEAPDLTGLARGIAYRIVEHLGVLERPLVSEDAKALDQNDRAVLRKYGVRFGAYHLFVPALLKPAPGRLLATLWALKNADFDVPGLIEVPQLSASGRTSIPVDPAVPVDLYRVCGFKACGGRAVRIDILERLADIIRPILAWRPGPESGTPPEGAYPTGGGFMPTVRMTSLVGCSGEDFASILKGLGYRMERRPAPAKPVEALVAETPSAEAAPAPAEAAEDAASETDVATVDATESVASVSDADAVAADEAAPEGVAAEETAATETAAPEAAPAADAEAPTAAEEPSEIEAAQADVADAAAEPASDDGAAAPAEPELVEVWRPGGRGDRRQGEGGRRHPPRRAEGERGRDGQARRYDRPRPEGGRQEGGRQDGGRPDQARADGPRQDRRAGGEGGQGAPHGQRRERPANQESRGEGGRPPRRDDRRDRNAERGDRPQGDRPQGGRDERQNRSNQDRSFQDRNRQDRPRADKPIDPNSPFAALAALKADLERRGR
ncbi:helicase-related protein [Segnochrobactrum spirostomi]|uniref:Helicase n=1 Tax=Segnochrobactrum spirostomi TaxID=2608987 RepID=A0A6A7Y1R5_9HYPH|nr:helicase-related protein [Segnochrobactrum spirostomi]MQT12954.1 helicase [Segnochrobactrum spirostomi]